MAKIELVLPAMGEGIIEATIIRWLVEEGGSVEEDQPLVEVATDKVDTEIPSPVKGIVSKILMKDGETPAVGAVLAIIDSGAADGEPAQKAHEDDGRQGMGASASSARTEEPLSVQGQSPGDAPGHQEIPRQTPSGKFLTPLVRNIAKKENISSGELDNIKGSGEGGRITKEDLLKYLEQQKVAKTVDESHAIAGPSASSGKKQGAGPADDSRQEKTEEKIPDPEKSQPPSIGEGDRIIEMDRMRKLIAGRMVSSKQISPHVTSFIDADVTGLVRWREAMKDRFLEREHQKLTFMPLFIEAAVKALRDYPMVNVSVDGSNIIVKKNINIGIAVALPTGNLIVPVIKNADERNLSGLARAVNDLAGRARSNKLQAHEISGGTFTITNFGTFGNTTGTPIINQPEVAILGTGVIQKKPVVLETGHGDVIAIRHMMTLSLAYDHRVIDGALGGMFLKRIAEYLESFNDSMDSR
jgi:2-oxoglutarate dehydrogenase E2 component (dihydrolipoamide succinyltransferase)